MKFSKIDFEKSESEWKRGKALVENARIPALTSAAFLHVEKESYEGVQMAKRKDARVKMYYFIDIELAGRKIIGWGTEARGEVEIELSAGFHRLFVSAGQYNKLLRQLEASKP